MIRQHPFIELRHILSPNRVEGYRSSPQESDLLIFARYMWNLSLSEALYPSLHALEIALRNSIHDTLSQGFSDPLWFDRVGLLDPSEVAKVAEAKQELTRNGKQHDPGRIIAELQFGFWTSMLKARYDVTIWRRYIVSAFPYIPRSQRTRKNISKRLNQIRQLRNRIFHHEPIWRYPTLGQMHTDILEAISWISLDLRSTVELFDRFPEVNQNGLHTALTKTGTFVQGQGFAP